MKIIHKASAKTEGSSFKLIRYMAFNSYGLIIMMTPLLLHFLLQLLVGFLQEEPTEKPNPDDHAAATAVAASFFTAVVQGHNNAALAFITADSHDRLEEFSLAVADEQVEQKPPAVVKQSVTAGSASVTLQYQHPVTMHLVKEQGAWKVDLLSTASDQQKTPLQLIYEKLTVPEKQI